MQRVGAQRRARAMPPTRHGQRRDLRFADVLRLQRMAGNAAVTGLLTGRPTVQRHQGIDPAASAHIPTTAEQKDMPTVAEAPELRKEYGENKLEWVEVDKRIKEANKTPPTTDDGKKKLEADTKRLKEINDRQAEITRKLKVRVKGDEEETLKRNGIKGGSAAWFADVKPMTFLDRPATVHKLLADRLRSAEAVLKNLPKPANGWVQEGHSTLREPGQSLHSFGLAIDLNPATNPFLVRATGTYEPAAWSTAIIDAINRAIVLVLGKDPTAFAFFTRPDEADKDTRAEKSYDKVKEASDALKKYLTLADKAKLPELEALLAYDPKKRTAAAWVKLIKADKTAIKNTGAAKRWKSPQEGFLNLNKDLVKAMTASTGAGLTWLGDDTIAGRDIMHFDVRGVGPIKGIWNSENKTYTGLGSG